ncbi:MAG: TIGR01906 family membrane protein [Bacillota bacterium]
MRTIGRGLIVGLSGISLLVLTLLIQVQVVAYSVSYYQNEFAKLHLPDTLQTDLQQLARFSRHTTRYLRGLENDPNVLMVIWGREQLLLNQREVAHMRDVQLLFRVARWISAVGLGVWIALFIHHWRKGRLRAFFRFSAVSSCIGVLIGSFVAWLISRDFTAAFDYFHRVSFTNDLWQLNPQVDQLINLLPEQFFADAVWLAAVRSALTLVGLALLTGIGSLRRI